MRAWWVTVVGLGLVVGCAKHNTPAPDAGAPDAGAFVPELVDAGIFVQGVGVTNHDCRAALCSHNENTDMVRWNGAIYLVHRTADSQVLGPNSSLHVYRSTDEGAHFEQTAVILAPEGGGADAGYGDAGFEAPSGRDLRDPSFYVVGSDLYLKALTRLPVNSLRDSNVETIAVESHSSDGVSWSPPRPIGPPEWSYWRIKEQAGTYYTAAYQDGDRSVVLFRSTDGVQWTRGAEIYGVSAMTPLETELTFLPSGRLLALVRTDGNDAELLGDAALQTQVCWATPPYDSFSCGEPLHGVRLDGPLSFWKDGRLFVMARKHLGSSDKKRTALYEITGDLEGGPIDTREWLVLPSAGDTSYAGGVPLANGDWLFSWYSSDLSQDEIWVLGILDAADIWLGTVRFKAP